MSANELPSEPPLVSALVELWADVLGRPCDQHSDFFELGGDSITALRLVARVRSLVDQQVSLGLILDAATPLELAVQLFDERGWS